RQALRADDGREDPRGEDQGLEGCGSAHAERAIAYLSILSCSLAWGFQMLLAAHATIHEHCRGSIMRRLHALLPAAGNRSVRETGERLVQALHRRKRLRDLPGSPGRLS